MSAAKVIDSGASTAEPIFSSPELMKPIMSDTEHPMPHCWRGALRFEGGPNSGCRSTCAKWSPEGSQECDI
jgi:hypothetical protein